MGYLLPVDSYPSRSGAMGYQFPVRSQRPHKSTEALAVISYLFVLIMMVIGGVIGYLADSWGHKIGKKRLSFLNLRPRHTATLITVGAGVLIPLVTVVIVAVVSSDVRAWLFEGQRAIRRSQDLQKQVDSLEERSKSLNKIVLDKATEQALLDSKLAATVSQLREFQAKAQKNMDAANKAAAKAQSLTLRVAQISKELTGKKDELLRAKGSLAALQEERRKLLIDFNTTNAQREELSKENLKLQADTFQLEKDLSKRRAEVADLTAQRNDAEALLKDAKEQLETTRKKMDESTQKLEESYARLVDAENRAKNAADAIVVLNDKSRFNPMIFSINEELARVQVPPNRTQDEADALLQTLLRQARVTAEKGGAAGNADYPVAGLFPKKDPPVSVVEQEDQIIRALTGKGDDYVIIAYAFANAFRGEWVPLTIRGFPNPLVYKSGKEIARTEIDGRMPEKDIIDAINDFIRTKVTRQAINDKMIPMQGRPDALGTVPGEEIVSLVKDIKEFGKRAKVRAVAAQDTRAADPLKLKLTVR